MPASAEAMTSGESGSITAEVNQSTKSHEMVNKADKLYRFTDDNTEQFDDEFTVPACDMSAYLSGGAGGMEAFAQQLGDSLTEVGFAVLTGHGVAAALISGATDATKAVMERELDAKLAFAASRPPMCSVNQGFFRKGETSSLTADLVEGWVLTRRAFPGLAAHHGPRGQHAGITPSDGGGTDIDGRFMPADCEGGAVEQALTEYVQAMEQLPAPITRAMLHYLVSTRTQHSPGATFFSDRLLCNTCRSLIDCLRFSG